MSKKSGTRRLLIRSNLLGSNFREFDFVEIEEI